MMPTKPAPSQIILDRLKKVHALWRGATTLGEREAAQLAFDRVKLGSPWAKCSVDGFTGRRPNGYLERDPVRRAENERRQAAYEPNAELAQSLAEISAIMRGLEESLRKFQIAELDELEIWGKAHDWWSDLRTVRNLRDDLKAGRDLRPVLRDDLEKLRKRMQREKIKAVQAAEIRRQQAERNVRTAKLRDRAQKTARDERGRFARRKD
jgi:hypothetical protein